MIRPYYSKHNLPSMKRKIISIPTKINRNFYRSLRQRGRTHTDIMFMIQPDRRNQFYQDILPLLKGEPTTIKPLSRWGKFLKWIGIKK